MSSVNSILRTIRARLLVLLMFVAVLVMLALVTGAWGETKILHRGEPAPYEGLLLDEAAAIQAATDVRDKASLQAEQETLQAEAATLQQEVSDLKTAVADKDKALELADQREKLRDEIEAKMKTVLEMSERAMVMSQQAAEVSIKAAQASTAALEKMHEKVDKERSRGFWGTILGFLAGLFAGVRP